MSLVFSGIYRFEDFELNPARRAFERNGAAVAIPPRTFDLLAFLVANPARVVTKDELLGAVWPESFVEESNLTQHVFVLRKALGDRAGLIVTVPGRGYQFIAEVLYVPHEALQAAALEPVPPQGIVVSHVRESTRLVVETATPVLPAPPTAGRLRLVLAALIPSAVLALALLVYWQSRPATPRIASYQQITRDGEPKSIGGTDGSRVYFTAELPHQIAQISVSGGLAELLPVSVDEPWVGAVSPDGSTLLIVSESGGMGPSSTLWSLRLIGHSLRRLAVAANDSAWSKDGTQLAYTTVTGDLYGMASDGTGGHKLASPGGYLRSPSWSPDGNRIRFSRDGQIWEIDANGGNLHALLPGFSRSNTQTSGSWAPDGRYYFVSDGQIWLLDERPRLLRFSAPKPVQMTFGPILWDKPVLSRDGQGLYASGRTKRGQLVRFDQKSGQFQPFFGGISAEFVTFSADARSVAYVTYPEGILWRAQADGSNPVQLTTPPVYPKSVRWSPDGREFLFVDTTASGANAIYVLPAEGGQPRLLIPSDTESQTDPSWSPDSRQVVYSTCPSLGVCSKSDLRILDVASGQSRLVPGSEGMVSPHWSPDGRQIAAMTIDAMSMKLFEVSTGRWSPLATGTVAFPEWSRDSKTVYYLRWGGESSLARIHPGQAAPELLVGIKNENYTGYYTSWMNLDPTGAPLLLRDLGSDDIYSLTLAER